MTARPQPLSRDQQLVMGKLVAEARRHGMPWKELEDWLGCTRSTLWRYARRAPCNKKGDACNITALAPAEDAPSR